ncbi:MAG: Arc family DNA binding domain-containing protein [Acidobacteriia bacterium]|nr:Arc family DNA binding domain-containing protein [Terriglobia bacterium]
MAERKSFLLRVDPAVMMALERWAGDELRSLNGQIEYLLRRALQKEGRLPPPDARPKGREDGKRG